MSKIKPTESELEILQVLWETGPATVRAVNERLNEHREVGYTTTLKILQIMHEKGLVTRQGDGRTHIYASADNERSMKGALVQQFVDAAFRGSAAQLVMQALGNHQASPEELAEIKALISQIEQNQK